jgi:hypothetical protein
MEFSQALWEEQLVLVHDVWDSAGKMHHLEVTCGKGDLMTGSWRHLEVPCDKSRHSGGCGILHELACLKANPAWLNFFMSRKLECFGGHPLPESHQII